MLLENPIHHKDEGTDGKSNEDQDKEDSAEEDCCGVRHVHVEQ